MAGASIAFRGGLIKLKASAVDPELWFAYDSNGILKEKGELIDLIITYGRPLPLHS